MERPQQPRRVRRGRRPVVRLRTLLGLVLLSAGLPAAATEPIVLTELADLPFEQLLEVTITSASKFSQPAREAPSAVQVLTADDIRRYGWRTLTEALGALPGFFSLNDRAYDFVGVRGFLVPGDYNTRFLLLLDGQRINDNIFEQALFGDEFVLDLELVERIEYIPGPGSSIYGANALFGVVNVITKTAGHLDPATVRAEASSTGWRRGRIGASRVLESGSTLTVAASRGVKGGRNLTYDDPDGNLLRADGGISPDGLAHGLDRKRLSRAYLRYTSGEAQLAAWSMRRDVHPSSALYGTLFDDDGLRIEDGQSGLMLTLGQPLTGHMRADARIAYQEVLYRADYPFLDDDLRRYINRDDTRGRWWSGEARLTATAADHTLVAGVELQRDIESVQRNFDVGGELAIDARVKSNRTGFYVQDEWRFASATRLNAGVRHDRLGYGRSYTSPRLGLIWNRDAATTVKVLAGRAYRAANAYETAYADNNLYLANPALEAETIRTLELVLERELGGGAAAALSAYDYHLDNVIRQVAVGDQLQYQNQPAIEARGIELGYRVQRADGLKAHASLALSRATDAQGEALGNSPRWVAKLGASRPLAGARWLAAVEAAAVGGRDFDWNGERLHQRTSVRVNAALTATGLAPGLELQLRVVNLLDDRASTPSSEEVAVPRLPAERRSWEAALNYAF